MRDWGAQMLEYKKTRRFILSLIFLVVWTGAWANPLRVVTDNNYPPYVFQGQSGQVEGYVVDIWTLWEKKTGVKVEFTAMQWSEAQRTMLDGEADVIDMIFRTPARERLYDYSSAYAKLPVGIYVHPSINGIVDANSVQGFSVGVQRGDACIDKLTSLGIINLQAFPNYESILAAAESGSIKMFCMDEEPANYFLYLYRDRTRFAKAFTLYEGEFHWAVAKGNAATFELVSKGMQAITAAEREALRAKWFKYPIQFKPYLQIVLALIGGSLLVIIAGYVWIRSLRRAVAKKTTEIRLSNELLQKTAAQLAIEKAQLRTIFDNSPDAMVLKDNRGVYIDCNAVFLSMIGSPREQVIGSTDKEIFPDQKFVAGVRGRDQEVLQGSYPIRYETSVTNVTGEVIELEVIKIPFAVTDNEQAGILAVARDITERRRAERELRISAVAFESHDGMIITDRNAIIERVNSAYTRITGYSATEAIGHTPRLAKSGLHEPGFYQEMWRQLESEGYWTGEITDKHRSGSLFTARLSITAVRDENGNVIHFVGCFQDVTAEKQAREQADHLKLFDQLTDLPNRTLFEDRLAHALLNSEKQQELGAVIMLDLDYFQKINDALGHTLGDQLLVETARRIRTVSQEADTLCRFSGDSFMLLLEYLGADPNAAASRALAISDQIRQAIAEPLNLNGLRLVCTASIGVTLFFCQRTSVETLLRQAEMAMYKSKKGGRNAVSFFEDALQAETERRHWMENELRVAISNKQLDLYYQVQVDTCERPIGAEALIRWIHPERGVIPPNEFIPLAEETGLILAIGSWVIETACNQLARWSLQDDLNSMKLAINVSTRQFDSERFVEDIEDELKRTGIDATKLKLEVTESLAIDDFDKSITKLRKLRDRGFRISIDDFGTGNSSLRYLTRLPITQLKIDKSFVDNLPSNQRDGMLAQTIIAMGRGLGLDVIAEGVETPDQKNYLETHGCHAFQGYLFGKPLPLAEFEAAVREMNESAARP